MSTLIDAWLENDTEKITDVVSALSSPLGIRSSGFQRTANKKLSNFAFLKSETSANGKKNEP